MVEMNISLHTITGMEWGYVSRRSKWGLWKSVGSKNETGLFRAAGRKEEQR